MYRRLTSAILAGFIGLPLLAHPAVGQRQKMIAEKIEWTWEVTPEHSQSNLPNVLLVGDSITRNYFPFVDKDLSGKANVYLFATSASVGDPRLLVQLKEFFAMEHVSFRVVHFNNGMHGWGFTETEYKEAFPSLVHLLRKENPGAKLIWATTTPVRKDAAEGATNARINTRNGIAASIVGPQQVSIDHQHNLIEQHPGMYSDDVHPDAKASAMQGQQAAAIIGKLL